MSRDELYQPPDAAERLRSVSRSIIDTGGTEPAELIFPLRPPEAIDRDIARLARVVRDGMPTLILCDNDGPAERLEELLHGWACVDAQPPRWRWGCSMADSLCRRAVSRAADFGFSPITRSSVGSGAFAARDGMRAVWRWRRSRRSSRATTLCTWSTASGSIRGIETIFVKESTVEVAVVEYEGGDRLNVPLYRIDQLERYRAAGDVSADAPPPRLHKLGGKRWAQQRDKTRAAIRGMTVGAARSVCAATGRAPAAARAG